VIEGLSPINDENLIKFLLSWRYAASFYKEKISKGCRNI